MPNNKLGVFFKELDRVIVIWISFCYCQQLLNFSSTVDDLFVSQYTYAQLSSPQFNKQFAELIASLKKTTYGLLQMVGLIAEENLVGNHDQKRDSCENWWPTGLN